MILIEINHICCLQYQTKMLRGRAQLFLTNPRKSKFMSECQVGWSLIDTSKSISKILIHPLSQNQDT